MAEDSEGAVEQLPSLEGEDLWFTGHAKSVALLVCTTAMLGRTFPVAIAVLLVALRFAGEETQEKLMCVPRGPLRPACLRGSVFHVCAPLLLWDLRWLRPYSF